LPRVSEREGDGGGSERPGQADRESGATGAGRDARAAEGHASEAADPFEGLVLDEDFIRGATHTEGSARARMLAEKWRREPPRNTGFREAANKTAAHGFPERGKRRVRRRTDRASRPARRDRTNLKVAVWFVLVAVLLMVLANRG
jgi:anti-sigma factor RsiW